MHYFMLHDIGQESTQPEFILNDIKVMDSFQINKELYLKLISGNSMLNLPLMMLVRGVFPCTHYVDTTQNLNNHIFYIVIRFRRGTTLKAVHALHLKLTIYIASTNSLL